MSVSQSSGDPAGTSCHPLEAPDDPPAAAEALTHLWALSHHLMYSSEPTGAVAATDTHAPVHPQLCEVPSLGTHAGGWG